MTLTNYQVLVGQKINGLEIEGILGYDGGRPVYSCRCSQCNSVSGVSHNKFRSGSARCMSPTHGRPSRAPGSTSSAAVVVRNPASAASREFAEFQREERQKEEHKAKQRALRDAEAQLQQSADELARQTRQMIEANRDVDWELPQSVAGKRMTVDDARQFNAVEAQKFSQQTPEFYPSEANKEALFSFLSRNGVSIADAATFKAAYLRLKDYELLEDRPPEAEPTAAEAEPQPSNDLLGTDPQNGELRQYTKREVDHMDAETYRRAFGLFGERKPRFIDMRK